MGVLSAHCEYVMRVKIMNMGADNQRIRLVPPKYVGKEGEDGPPAQISVSTSSTKLFPGLAGCLTIRANCLAPGAFAFEFGVVGEAEEYTLTVTGQVLTPDNFEALALFRKLEGKGQLDEGVVLVQDYTAEHNVEASMVDESGESMAPESVGGEGEGSRVCALDSLYDADLLDDVKFWPTLPGVYFDKTSGMMEINKAEYCEWSVDGAVSVSDVFEKSSRGQIEGMKGVEAGGNLSRRVIEQLREEGGVEKHIFGMLSRSMRGDNK